MTATAVRGLATPADERKAGVADGAAVDLVVAFTDLEGFTAYTEVEGDDAASRLLIGHHRGAETIVRGRGGRVVKRLGDGLMLTFPAPDAAVLACLELGEAAPLPLRAGIHGGKVVVRDDEVIGRVVNLAARATQSASGRELVVTDYVRSAVIDLPGVAFSGPHARSFKGIEETVAVYIASRRPTGRRPTQFATGADAQQGGLEVQLVKHASDEPAAATARIDGLCLPFDVLGEIRKG